MGARPATLGVTARPGHTRCPDQPVALTGASTGSHPAGGEARRRSRRDSTARACGGAADEAERGRDTLGRRRRGLFPEGETVNGRLATVFNETLARLQDSFERLRRFTADASHELRTPLMAMRSVGEVALHDSLEPAAYRDVIGSMLEEVERLTTLVESLLMLARVDSRRAQLEQEEQGCDERQRGAPVRQANVAIVFR